MKKENFSRAWNAFAVQTVALIVLSVAMNVLHIGNDMNQWTLARFREPCLLSIAQFVLISAHSCISIFLFLLLCVRCSFFAYGLLPVVLFAWVVPLYLRITMGHCLYSELITGALGTNWDELSKLFTLQGGILSCAFLVSCSFFCVCVRRCFPLLGRLSCVSVWCCSFGYLVISSGAVLLLSEFSPRHLVPVLYHPEWGAQLDDNLKLDAKLTGMKNEYHPEYPYRVLLPFYRQLALLYYVVDYYKVHDIKKAEMLTSHSECSDDDVVVILFIGESYRADHASWNGYERDTLPKLSSRKNNIINFPYFKSFATSTATSIYGILSDATCQNREATYTSFVGLMRKHGFSSNLLLCRTTEWQRNPKINLILDGNIQKTTICTDSSDVVACIRKLTETTGKHFIMLEDGTGHAPYSHEPQFACFGDTMVDRYDNSLLQTDDLLWQIVESLKDKKAVMLYTSDHGQSFGEQGAWMHGGSLNVIKQRHVFSFVWHSDTYAAAHPGMISAMQLNANKALSHDDIYQSILSLSGIESQSPNPQCRDFTKPLNAENVGNFSLD